MCCGRDDFGSSYRNEFYKGIEFNYLILDRIDFRIIRNDYINKLFFCNCIYSRL